jgi:hypothetical protein
VLGNEFCQFRFLNTLIIKSVKVPKTLNPKFLWQWASPVTRGTDVGRLRGTHAAVVHPLHPLAILVYGGYGGVGSQWLDDLSILHTGILETTERKKGELGKNLTQ